MVKEETRSRIEPSSREVNCLAIIEEEAQAPKKKPTPPPPPLPREEGKGCQNKVMLLVSQEI